MLVIDSFKDYGFKAKTEVLNRKSRLVYRNIKGVVRKFREVYTYTYGNSGMEKVIIDIREVV